MHGLAIEVRPWRACRPRSRFVRLRFMHRRAELQLGFRHSEARQANESWGDSVLVQMNRLPTAWDLGDQDLENREILEFATELVCQVDCCFWQFSQQESNSQYAMTMPANMCHDSKVPLYAKEYAAQLSPAYREKRKRDHGRTERTGSARPFMVLGGFSSCFERSLEQRNCRQILKAHSIRSTARQTLLRSTRRLILSLDM